MLADRHNVFAVLQPVGPGRRAALLSPRHTRVSRSVNRRTRRCDEPEGAELQLALDDNPAAKAYQQAIFQQGQPAIMFQTNDVRADYERIKSRGGELTMPPTETTGSTIAMVGDGCGNLIQIVQLARW